MGIFYVSGRDMVILRKYILRGFVFIKKVIFFLFRKASYIYLLIFLVLRKIV